MFIVIATGGKTIVKVFQRLFFIECLIGGTFLIFDIIIRYIAMGSRNKWRISLSTDLQSGFGVTVLHAKGNTLPYALGADLARATYTSEKATN